MTMTKRFLTHSCAAAFAFSVQSACSLDLVVQPANPSPTPPTVTGGGLPLGSLTFPTVTGAAPGLSNPNAGTGASRSSPTDATSPVNVNLSTGGGGGGSTPDRSISFQGHLNQPTFVAPSAATARVSNEAELRAALANTSIDTILFLNNIDLAADSTTFDLALTRAVTIDGSFGDSFTLSATPLTVSSGSVSLKNLTLPNAITFSAGSELGRMTNCVLGANDPSTAVTITSSVDVRLLDCTINGRSTGVKVETGSVVTLERCTIAAPVAANLQRATLNTLGGTFTDNGTGIFVFAGVLDVDGTTFNGPSTVQAG